MKKIAILTCLQSNDVCTRYSCLKAFNDKNDYFSTYNSENIELVAVWTCQGCNEINLSNDDGLKEKLQCIVNAGVEVVHIGKCCYVKGNDNSYKKCDKIIIIEKYLEQNLINVVWGTHN